VVTVRLARGCIAVILLARLGYKVVLNRQSRCARVPEIFGAHEVIDRSQLAARSDKPLERGAGGAVDSVSGKHSLRCYDR